MKKYKIELKAKTVLEFELEDESDLDQDMKLAIEGIWQEESPFLSHEYEWKVLDEERSIN